MNQDEKNRVQVALCGLWQTLKPEAKPLPIETQRAYLMALADLGVERIEQACGMAIQRCTFFPKPVELREMVDDPKYRASAAWELALIHGVTRRAPLDFDDRLINACIRRLGGLDHFAQLGHNEANRFIRGRFIEEYLTLDSQVELPASAVAPLRCEITNKKEAIRIPCDYQPKQLRITTTQQQGHEFITDDLVKKLTVNK